MNVIDEEGVFNPPDPSLSQSGETQITPPSQIRASPLSLPFPATRPIVNHESTAVCESPIAIS